MSINRSAFGRLEDGRQIERYELQSSGGLKLSVLTYGATIQSLVFDGRDVVLGYDRLEDYLVGNDSYQGATVGRYANRIAEGRFRLNGIVYDVGCNESGRGHLHGGVKGFDKQVWKAEVAADGEEPSLRMTYRSADGEEGYPGAADIAVTFTVAADNALHIRYEGVSDRDTVLNMTNHSYFNLNGFDGGDVLDTMLTIPADNITPVDALLMPTGSLLPVEGTPFDFRQGKPIGRDIGAEDAQLQLGGGYDHNYVLGMDRRERLAAAAYAPRSGIRMECRTDLPGVQLYTANGLNAAAGKGGIPLYKHQGFCLETQFFPDSPNQPAFPSAALKAGEAFASETVYRFYKD